MKQPGLMHVGVAHHLGWAVVVVADDDHSVVDRRRVELVERGLPAAPIHHEGGAHELHRTGPPLDDTALARLVESVRESVTAMTAKALDEVAEAASAPIETFSVRTWPDDFPTDVAVLRKPPYESRADSVMYLQTLAGEARARGWDLHRYDGRRVEVDASELLERRASDVLRRPRAALGPPWNKDHRMALAATVVAARRRAAR